MIVRHLQFASVLVVAACSHNDAPQPNPAAPATASAQPTAPAASHVIVTLADGAGADVVAELAKLGFVADPGGQLGNLGIVTGHAPPDALDRLRAVKGVKAVELDAPVSAEAPPRTAGSDDDFRAAVKAFATARHREISAWGTLHLDGSAKPYRFATLDVQLSSDDRVAPGSASSGAYIIEQDPTTYWLVGYAWNAGSFHRDGATGVPKWAVLEDSAIAHAQLHNHGKATAQLGLRDGKLVVLAENDDNTRSDPELVEHVYAKGGACQGACPMLAGHEFRGMMLSVVGPARSISALPEPSRDGH